MEPQTETRPIRLPLIEIDGRLAAETLGDHYRHLLSLAMQADLPARPFDFQELKTAPMRLSVPMLAKLQNLADTAQVDLKAAFASLCSDGQAIQKKHRHAQGPLVTVPQPLDTALFKSAQQAAFYTGLLQGLAENKVVLSEGSTGLGKGRAIAMAAIEQARAGKTPVVISAPSLALVGQLHTEVMNALGGALVPVALVVGSNEFVDDEALLTYLDRAQVDAELPVDEGVRLWAAGGGKPLNPNSLSALAAGGSAAWLMEDLRALGDAMPVDDFSLSEDVANGERSEARLLVMTMRERARNLDGIILCSHMMLAAAQRSRWNGGLPPPKCILIDEAHLFESAVTRVNSVQLSLFSIRVSLMRFQATNSKGPSAPATVALREIGRLGAALQPLGEVSKRGSVVLSDPEAISDKALADILGSMAALRGRLGSKAMRGMQHLELYRGALDGVIRGLERKAFDKVQLQLSPVRGYPSIQSGPANVGMQLRDLWKTAEGGVGLVSATLYAMGEDGEYHCDYIRNVLSVPLARAATPPPAREAHITAIPTVHTVGVASFATFVPPAERTEDEDQWAATLAGAISRIAASARGGTMVLCTAYEDVRRLGNHLAETLGDRLVVQTPDHRFVAYVAQYKGKHAQGLRPVLIGAGVAWTGIDLVDSTVAPEEDWMLTDLVVARLPINLNHSSTTRGRTAYMGLYPVINEALLSLKQGLGRLVRRDGVTDRNIWVLDGRIHPKFSWPGMVRLTAGARRLLRDYPTRKEVDF